MKLRNLEALLEGFEPPPEPKIELEQYATPPRIAAEVIFNACNTNGDIEGKNVADLGSGCGILSIAALCMGANKVDSYDIDPVSIEAAKRNLDKLSFEEEPNITFNECDVTKLNVEEKYDTVIMNPPFGTRTKGIDMEFLEVASKISTGAIYSFHKTSTRKHVLDIAAPKLGLKGKLMLEVDFDLKKLYKFHKKAVKAIQVDIYRFEHIPPK